MNDQQAVGPNTSTFIQDDPSWGQPRRRGWVFLALCTSFVLPGLGHIVIRRSARGLVWFIVMAGVNAGLLLAVLASKRPWLLPVFTGLAASAFIAMLVDVIRCTRRGTPQTNQSAIVRYALGLLCLSIAFTVAIPGRVTTYVRAHYADTFKITSLSMKPVLQPDDCFVARRHVFIARWDIVVFRHPEYDDAAIAMRVAGLPGETVEIRDGGVSINGQLVPPPPGVGPYRSIALLGQRIPSVRGAPCNGCEGNGMTLGADEYFVLGDNSEQARDARLWEIAVEGHQVGALPRSHIVGRAVYTYWPPSRWREF